MVGKFTYAVRRGIKFLDSRVDCPCPNDGCEEDGPIPSNWRDLVDVSKLNLSSGQLCVLGQILGSYGSALIRLDLSLDDARHYGFASEEDQFLLTAEWVRQLDLKRPEPKAIGDVYHDGIYALKIVEVFELNGRTAYICDTGRISGGAFDSHDDSVQNHVVKDDDFSGYPTKLGELVIKGGMFLTDHTGKVYYTTEERNGIWLFEVAQSVTGRRLETFDPRDFKEVTLPSGRKLSELVKD